MSAVAAAPAARDRRTLSLMAAGHACADLCQGSIAALVPFLATGSDGIGFGRTGVLLLVMSLTSSVVQPLIGLWADRHRADWSIPTGVALAGAGIALLGVAQSYPVMLVTVAVAGLGVALFHPEGARRATAAAGPRAAGGLGLFAVGGNAGFALAPVVITPAVLAFGRPGTAVVLVPTLLVATLLARVGGTPAESAGGERNPTGGVDRPGAFALVATLAALRAAAYFGAQTLLAATLVQRLDLTEAGGNATLTVMLVAGVGGTLAGGALADRRGDRPTLAAGFALSAVGVILVQLAPNAPAAVCAAALLGLATAMAYSPTIVLGQALLPNRQRLAAGTTIGLAIGVGGIAAAGLGALADATSPVTALWAVVAFPIAGTLLSAAVPDRRI